MNQFSVSPGQKSGVEKEQIINVHRTVKGFYKASIMEPDANGTINEAFSTGWKPNTILNSGLDKIAYMPWAQTFQFCLIGDYPYSGADPATASYDETMLKHPVKIQAFYLPGQGNCGHIISGSTIRLFRTFDFYKEFDNVTYTEVGFKETPAAISLFSKIRFDPTMSLHAGQFMRVAYELRVNVNPATSSAGGITPTQYPTFTGWTSGSLDKEAIQKFGMCVIDSGSGLATPLDEGGFCNEPFAPGQLSFGPGFGFVNRYHNGINVNYYPLNSVYGTGSISGSNYETNPFKAIGPLQEFSIGAGYGNIYQALDLGISASNAISGGKYSGSFCCPSTNVFLPRNHFTTDFIYGASRMMGGDQIYNSFLWNGINGVPRARYTNVQITAISGISVADTAWYYTGGYTSDSRFINLDNLWTPYSKMATVSSIGGTPLYSGFTNNTSLFNDYYYDPSLQTNGTLSYPIYPQPLAVPGGNATASRYEPTSSAAIFVGYGRIDPDNNTSERRINRLFPLWDDWNPFTPTASLIYPLNKVSNYFVRGSSMFLSTHTGSLDVLSASVDRSSNTSSKVFSIELPMTLAPYSQSSYYRDKYVIFSNLVGNNEDIPTTYWSGSSYPAWRSIGVGPTSLSINTATMNDAAKYNGYVYLLQNPQIKDKDYSLKMTFRYSWGRA
jgi:hypothetical protein